MAFVHDHSLASQLSEKFTEDDPSVGSKSIEAENVDILKRVLEAITAHQYHVAAEHFANDIVHEIHGASDVPFTTRIEGLNAVRDQLTKNFNSLSDQRPEVQWLVAQGDLIVLKLHETGTMNEIQTPYSARVIQTYLFRERKISSIEQVVERFELHSAIAPAAVG